MTEVERLIRRIQELLADLAALIAAGAAFPSPGAAQAPEPAATGPNVPTLPGAEPGVGEPGLGEPELPEPVQELPEAPGAAPEPAPVSTPSQSLPAAPAPPMGPRGPFLTAPASPRGLPQPWAGRDSFVGSQVIRFTGSTSQELQAALDRLQPGDTLILPNSLRIATGARPFRLPSHPLGSRTIIRAETLPAARPESPTGMPQIVAGNPTIVFDIPAGANSYAIAGVAFLVPAATHRIITVGDPTIATDTQPEDILLYRCYLEGNQTVRGIALDGRNVRIVECSVVNIPGTAAQPECQAIASNNGGGPYLIQDCYLEARTQAIMFGGSPAKIPNLIPSGVLIQGCHLYKRPEWATSGAAKNILELKRGKNFVIRDNKLENSFPRGQNAEAFVFTVRLEHNRNPWQVIEDIEVRDNVSIGIGSGINFLGRDNNSNHGGHTKRITVEGNLFVISRPPSSFGFQILTGTEDLIIRRNTVLGAKNAVIVDTGPTGSPLAPGWTPNYPITNLVIEQNILDGGLIGRASQGQKALDLFTRGEVLVRNNVVFRGAWPAGQLGKTLAEVFADQSRLIKKAGYEMFGSDLHL